MPDATQPSRRIAFAGIFGVCLLCFLGIGVVLPVLPRYVHGPVGAGDVAVGIVMGSFAFSAVVVRPIAGRAADRRGRRIVVCVGATCSAVAGALYFLPLGVPGLVAARLVLGVGEGCVFTAGATWAVDLSNEENRGRILGLFGLAIWSALATGPLLGQILLDNVSYDAVWAVACAAPLAAALLARSLPESPVVPRPGAERVPFLPRPTLRPGLALTLASIGHATFASFIVLHTAKQGIGHGAAVFAAFATAVVGARLLGGNLPDIVGPRRTAVAAAGAEAAGLVVIAQAHTLATAIIGSLVMGVGFSVLFPSLALLAVNEVGDAGRGAALGAVTAFFDVGQGIGGPIAGAISSAAGYGTAFMVAAVAAAAGGTVAALGAPRVRARVDAMRA